MKKNKKIKFKTLRTSLGINTQTWKRKLRKLFRVSEINSGAKP